jgi:hypothetical protein
MFLCCVQAERAGPAVRPAVAFIVLQPAFTQLNRMSDLKDEAKVRTGSSYPLVLGALSGCWFSCCMLPHCYNQQKRQMPP